MDIEYLFDAQAPTPFWSHPDLAGPSPVPIPIVFTLYSENDPEVGNIGQWQFEAELESLIGVPGVGDGEAFAYAESTAAIDLNGDDDMALAMADVI